MVLGLMILGNAALQNNGNGLIYDTDLKIIWYEVLTLYNTSTPTCKTWEDAKIGASTLTDGDTIVGSWRLPTSMFIYTLGFAGAGLYRRLRISR